MNRLLMVLLKNLYKIPGAYAKLCRYARSPEDYSEEEKYGHIRYILNHVIDTGNIDLVITGKENIPEEPGYMIYANHQGMFDFIAIVNAFEKPIAGVCKIELKDLPLMKQIIACTNSFAMDRDDVRQSLTVIQNVIAEVKKGRNYLIFPEGTRSRNGNEMLPFHGGSFRCATKTKCPIVPVALVDTHKVLDEKGSGKLQVQLHILPVIAPEEYAGMNTTDLAEMVKSRIAEKIAECAK